MVSDLLNQGLRDSPLTILLFGPQLKVPSDNEHDLRLQDKRRQVKLDLEGNGHVVVLIEDEIDGSLPPPLNNSWVQELTILQELDRYDLIVSLVHSPGTNIELGVISSKREVAAKSHLFLSSAYKGSAAHEACLAAQLQGAVFSEYEYPKDLLECHLVGMVRAKVHAVQIGKFLM